MADNPQEKARRVERDLYIARDIACERGIEHEALTYAKAADELRAALDREERLLRALTNLAKRWRASEELGEGAYIEFRVRVSVANRAKAECANDLDAALALAGPGQKGDTNG